MQWACIDFVEDTDELVGMGAEDVPDRRRLDLVVGFRSGAMGVDIVDVLGREPGIGKTGPHRRGRTFDGRRDDVGGVGRHAAAGELAEDRLAPRAWA